MADEQPGIDTNAEWFEIQTGLFEAFADRKALSGADIADSLLRSLQSSFPASIAPISVRVVSENKDTGQITFNAEFPAEARPWLDAIDQMDDQG